MELSILYLKGCLSNDMGVPLKTDFISANSADPDEMPHYAAFHQGLRCLPKNLFTGIQNEKGLRWSIARYK